MTSVYAVMLLASHSLTHLTTNSLFHAFFAPDVAETKCFKIELLIRITLVKYGCVMLIVREMMVVCRLVLRLCSTNVWTRRPISLE